MADLRPWTPFLKNSCMRSLAQCRASGEAVTPECLRGPPVDRDRRNVHPGFKVNVTVVSLRLRVRSWLEMIEFLDAKIVFTNVI
ncbi:hypothetical protein TNCV_2394001 [Trichonephila clavipes]|nr:hypothetical protein TNCV_2394001 [Trichonephila clavipes]